MSDNPAVIGVPQTRQTQAEPATVTQASPLLIRLDSSASSVPALHLTSYTPVLNDRVGCLRMGRMALVLGKFL
jgi:Flp pilus assembly protein TadG